MEVWNNALLETLCENLGKSVTIFTSSGGESGSGFSGVLLTADAHLVRLLSYVGAPPICPLGGSSCDTIFGPWGNMNDNYHFNGYPIGAITIIPIRSIVAFTQHAI